MKTEFACWKITVAFKDMDMSGGDNIDGPRWTGKFNQLERTVVIVAPTRALAEAAALSLFYEHQSGSVTSANKIQDVDSVIQLSTTVR